MRSVQFPAHRDLVGFEFEPAHVDETLVRELHEMKFLDSVYNLVLVGGPGTGRTHLATSLGVEAMVECGRQVDSGYVAYARKRRLAPCAAK